MSTVNESSLDEDLIEVLDRAAETFAILASPVRLRILQAVCDGERSVSEIVALVGQSQTNVSQHLALMYRGGVLTRRRSGTQHFYAVADPAVVEVCRVVCTRIASGSGRTVVSAPVAAPSAASVAPAAAASRLSTAARPSTTSRPSTATRRRSRG